MQENTVLALAMLFITTVTAGALTPRIGFDINKLLDILELDTDDNKNEKVMTTNDGSDTQIDELIIEQNIDDGVTKLEIDDNFSIHQAKLQREVNKSHKDLDAHYEKHHHYATDESSRYTDNAEPKRKYDGKGIKQYDAIDYKKHRLVDVHDDNNDNSDNFNLLVNNARRKREISDSCKILNEVYRKNRKPENLKVYMQGKLKNVYVSSTQRAPSRALAALLAAAIRYKFGYDNVYIKIDNRNIRHLAEFVETYASDKYFIDKNLLIHVDADWEELQQFKPALPGCNATSFFCSIAGSRLLDIGRAPSVNVNVYAVLSNENVNNENCFEANTWNFYKNYTALEQCGFLHPLRNNSSSSSKCIHVFILLEVPTKLDLESKTLANDVLFCKEPLSDRIKLYNRKDANSSFLFIDYDLGYDKSENGTMQIVKIESHLTETTIALRVADHHFFMLYAPKIADILSIMTPQPKDLREVLNIKNTLNNSDYENAACAWAIKNRATFEKWTNATKVQTWFLAIVCNDSDYLVMSKLVGRLRSILKEDITEFDFVPWIEKLNCTDGNIINNYMSDLVRRHDLKYSGGLTAPGFQADTILRHLTGKKMQVVFYNDPPTKTTLDYASTTTTGGWRILVLSICHFLKKQGWNRIAIISETSNLANSITAEFSHHAIMYKEVILDPTNIINITNLLLSLKQDNARIFFINAGPEAANSIVCEAAKQDMADDTEYAWISREWKPLKKCVNNVQVFTVSYGWRGGNDSLIEGLGGNAKIRSILNEMWNNTLWPIHGAQLMDAYLLMIHRVQAMLLKYPNHLYDIHSVESTRLIVDQLHGNESKAGVTQNLETRNNRKYNPLVYITAWRANVSNLVAIWRVISDTNDIKEINPLYEPYYGGKRPVDGTTGCMTTFGDEFNPSCYDPIWPCVALILVTIPIVWWRTRRARLIKAKKRERETLMRLLSRCEKTASVLKQHLVDRSLLELYEELGSGHFGRVRFGMLRVRIPTPVAAKTLRNDAAPAEEAEFLREASMMATLSHDHVVRLVGVCADVDGPPLLLMEHAFFGDLLKYLRQRRHLVEVNERSSKVSADALMEENLKKSSDPEARHVSPVELTRLGREAAQAVDYLAIHHILHRDIRAANCLVDARRVLKLADFGMARNVEVKQVPLDEPEESEDYKYICRRRGVFPVPWMAPESLDRGEFSRASDVWALGVLMLEIATLGARPYGAWKPMQVLRFVQSGGRPPLPRDSSYHTCELTEMCWNDLPEDRASAKNVAEYLAEHQEALRGALRPAWPEPDVVPDGSDSGFSERNPEHEWSKGADLRVSTL